MGTKTRSLGLSSLVVTTLDKGAAVELQTNGWTVAEHPLKISQVPYRGINSVDPTRKLSKAIALCNTESKKERITIELKWPSKASVVKKEGTGWRKRWNKRNLILDSKGLSLFKNENAKAAYKTIPISSISRVEKIKQGRLDNEYVFTISFSSNKESHDEIWTFAVSTEKEREEWRSIIATRVLVDEIAYGTGLSKNASRLQHFIAECGGQLEYEVAEDTPLVLFALYSNRKDIMASLLRKGVDCRCLLRLDSRIRSMLPPSEVVNLLEITGRDMNVVGDDDTIRSSGVSLERSITEEDEVEGCWSLIHLFVVQRDVESLERLLQRIDKPTLNLKTRGGETALSLALRKLHENDTTSEVLKKIHEIVKLLMAHGADPNQRCGSGDAPFHLYCKRSASLPQSFYQLFEESSILDVNKLDAFGDAPIHILMKLRQSQLAKRLVSDSRVDLNLRDSAGVSCLVLAMKFNEESFACSLLMKGADGSVQCTKPPPPSAKISTISPRAVRSGSSHQLVPEDEKALRHDYPIHLAIKLHLTSLALKLVEKLPVASLVVADGDGRTPLLLSVLRSLLGVSHAIVSRLSQDGYKGHLNGQDSKTGDTALHLAIRAGRVELTNSLLDAGADMSIRTAIGETAIHVCARFVERTYNSSGGYTALKLFNRMIEMDTKLGAASCINVPTHAVEKVPEVMRSAAQRLAKNCRGNMGAQTVLHMAASCESEQCGLWLLDALFKSPMLSLECLDGAGLTPLACGIDARNAEICKLLIARSSVDRLVGADKDSYLHLVMKQWGRHSDQPDDAMVSLVEMLLVHGAYCGHWDSAGLTPLHLACTDKTYYPMLQILLRNADVLTNRMNDRTECGGLTPLMIAVRQSHSSQIVGLLVESGADVRLLEPKTRRGVFQMCLEDGFDANPENLAVCVKLIQMIPENKILNGDEEWRARRTLMEKHAALLTAAEELLSKEQDMKLEESTPRRPSQPLVLCMERFAVSARKEPSATSGTKRGFDEAENTNGLNRDGQMSNKKTPDGNATVVSVVAPAASAFEVDQKHSEMDLASSDEDEDEEASDSATTSKGGSSEIYCQRLSQLDRMLEVERIRAEAMETAMAWLESESGKKMIAQVASVLISDSDEHITHEAAIELARRNFIEEQVKAGIESFETRVPSELAASQQEL